MFLSRVKMLRAAALSDNGSISKNEARQMTVTAGHTPASPQKTAYFEKVLQDSMDEGARSEIKRYLSGAPEGSAVGGVITHQHGPSAGSLADDAVFIHGNGLQENSAGLNPYTRSYAAIKDGPLRQAHGSAMPRSSVLTASEDQATRKQTPGQALDQAAKLLGSPVGGFDELANRRAFYNPSAAHWEGKCHAWCWAALSEKINTLVDIQGPEGKRGIWIAGQWLSRADLGNWTMGLADSLSISSRNVLFDARVTAKDVLVAMNQYIAPGGHGVIADIHLDSAHGGGREVWNQPFPRNLQQVTAVEGGAAEGVLAVAQADGITGGTQVKRVAITAYYGQEVGDGYEGEPALNQRNWNLYAVTDAAGKVLEAYAADDQKLSNVAGLPTTSSRELPEYFWKPDVSAIDAALDGSPHSVLDRDPHGQKFRFFVGSVLPYGVPGVLREKFEATLAGISEQQLSPQRAAQLAADFPRVASAYTPDQWARAFGARGLDAGRFGAVWAGAEAASIEDGSAEATADAKPNHFASAAGRFGRAARDAFAAPVEVPLAAGHAALEAGGESLRELSENPLTLLAAPVVVPASAAIAAAEAVLAAPGAPLNVAATAVSGVAEAAAGVGEAWSNLTRF